MMKPKIALVIRILFGVFCLIFGFNKLLNFIPLPPISGDGGTLMGIYMTSGFMKIIGLLEIIAGLALIVGKYVPLANIILLAIMFNALVFHLLHQPEGSSGAFLGLIFSLLVFYNYKEEYSDLLSA